MNTKKTIGTIALTTCLGTSVLAGCNSSTPVQKADTDPTKVPKLSNLTYWTGMAGQASATMKSYNEMEAYKLLEQKTGVKVEFQHPPQGQDAEQFNLMITSGQLPDVIEYHWTNFPGGPEKAIKDGRIIKLNDYIDKYAPNLKKVLNSNPEWRKQITTDDGSIISFPFIRGDKKLQVYQGPAIRQDWLDKLGLKPPTTLDEWYTVLKAFKERDPNGNGTQDEIPLLLRVGEINGTSAFIGAFGITNGYFQDKGKVKFGPVQPEFKEFLTLMNRWYKEGLLDRDYAATDDKLFDAKITGSQAGSAVLLVGGGIGKYANLMKDKDPNFKLFGVTYPVLRAGEKPQLGQLDFAFNGRGAAVTTSNKNPIETVKWLDYAYSEDGHMLFNFGKEGVSYNMVSGYPKWTDDIANNANGLPVQQAMARHNRASWDGPFVQDLRYFEQYASLPQQQSAVKLWSEPSNEKKMPLVTPTKDESSRFASIMADINTYKDEMFNKFVMGAEPLSSFDKYVQTIQGMGLEEALKIQQAALERYNSRK
ncbi:extracellular solute-binding protein [Paenibacillus sp. NPDC056579]|uniref:extracellular solute-binding protein n=1 Tax=unclassified Paenibacillus TaxID=185978 RepID=UPI001EF8DE7E|nr:extracellular solute-binding protein [Paenibacillus sp. H1-7]ULL14966.1 extracellular solute-binding protein [Paenibacillus sp. H1-7]